MDHNNDILGRLNKHQLHMNSLMGSLTSFGLTKFDHSEVATINSSSTMQLDANLNLFENMKINNYVATLHNQNNYRPFNITNNHFHSAVKELANYANLIEMTKTITSLVGSVDPSIANLNVIQEDFRLTGMLRQLTLSEDFVTSFHSVDWSTLNDISFDKLFEESEAQNSKKNNSFSEVLTTIEVRRQKKMVSELTVDELQDMITMSINPKSKALAIGTFFMFLFDDYIKDSALLILKISLAFIMNFTIDKSNADMKELIEQSIQSSTTIREAKNITSNFLNTPIVGEQIAFLRTDGFLREGRSRTAPAIKKISPKTVLSIIQKRGNWILVQIEGSNDCVEGWIEESKVIKFKNTY